MMEEVTQEVRKRSLKGQGEVRKTCMAS